MGQITSFGFPWPPLGEGVSDVAGSALKLENEKRQKAEDRWKEIKEQRKVEE